MYMCMMEEVVRVLNVVIVVWYDEEEEVQSFKKSEKDLLLEDCDVVVEDFSFVKVKYKQLQEVFKIIEFVKKFGDGWMVKVCNVIFGIGLVI